MKKIVSFCLNLLLIVFFLCPTVYAQNVDSDIGKKISTSDYGIDSSNTLLGNKRIVDNIKSAIVFEVNSSTLMYALNADSQMFPASFVKIMTALLAIEMGDLDELVTVSENAVSAVPNDAVKVGLIAGEQMRLEDMLYCMLLGSANDAAVAIAEHIGGSEAAFAEMMNNYAAGLGCKNTHYVNAHGLHSQSQYTTARDTAKVLAAAVSNEKFYSIFSATKYTVQATNQSQLRNLVSKNDMMDPISKLYYDNRVIGGRTGVTEDGRRCLASVAESNGMQLITVVMGAESVYQEDGYTAIRIGGYQETTALLDAGFTGYKSAQVLYAGQSLRQMIVLNGDCELVIGPNKPVVTVLSEKAQLDDLDFRYTDLPLTAPVEQGTVVSVVEIWYDNMCIAREELFALNIVRIKTTASGSENTGNKRILTTVLVIALGVPAGVFLILLGIRSVGIVKHMISNSKSRKYRRSRRRSR